MKYFIIAGEASGDLHGSNLMAGLMKVDKEAEFVFFGGDLMQAKGGKLIRHYREMAFMGYIEVLKNIRTISRNFKICKNEIKKYRPDVVILIDYPSFNLKIAEFARLIGLKVYYYISPKIWAWKEYRIKKIKKFVDKMFVILPFEVDFYKKHHYPVCYEGNPLLDSVNEKLAEKPKRETFLKNNQLSDKPIIALLPGSRTHEIKRILPVMINSLDKYTEYQMVIAGTSALEREIYFDVIQNNNIELIFDQTYELLMHADLAIVTSGTAALETALLDIPQVVCYITSKSSYFIAKAFVKLNYISLPNLIMDKLIVKELIQDDMNVKNLQEELDKIIYNSDYKKQMLENYIELKRILGNGGASKRFAEQIFKSLSDMNKL